MDLLNVDGTRKQLTEQEAKDREAHLRAKVVANARKRGIMKVEYKGMIKGEPIFGDPLDGFSEDALGLMEDIAAKHGKPSLVQPQQEARPLSHVVEAVNQPKVNRIDVAKDVFGF